MRCTAILCLFLIQILTGEALLLQRTLRVPILRIQSVEAGNYAGPASLRQPLGLEQLPVRLIIFFDQVLLIRVIDFFMIYSRYRQA